jgi:hypothetical protein
MLINDLEINGGGVTKWLASISLINLKDSRIDFEQDYKKGEGMSSS